MGTIAAMVGLADEDVAELVTTLALQRLTVACAESLTGGLLTALLTEVPGASAVVRGGLVVYATDLKHSLAGVDSALLAERGPVDPDVALELAQGVRNACGSVIGLGLTGVAGPDPQNGIAVGTWFVALVGEGRSTLTASPAVNGSGPARPPDGRSEIRAAAVRAAVGLLDDLARNESAT